MNFGHETGHTLRSNAKGGRVEINALSFAHLKVGEKHAALWWAATPASKRALSESVKGHKS